MWIRSALLLALVMSPSLARTSAGIDIRLDAEELALGDWKASRLSVSLGADTALAIEQISHAGGVQVGSLELKCDLPDSQRRRRCTGGQLDWIQPGARSLGFSFQQVAGELSIARGTGRARLAQNASGHVQLKMEKVDLEWLPPAWLESFADLAEFSGLLDLDARFGDDGLEIDAALEEVAFDTVDGRYAGAGIGLGLELALQQAPTGLMLQSSARWNRGELLLGTVYLPEPEVSWGLELDANGQGADWQLQRLLFEREGGLALHGNGYLSGASGWAVRQLDLVLESLDLGWLWNHGLQSQAAAIGWGELAPAGHARGRLSLQDETVRALELSLADVSLRDAGGRLSLQELAAELEFRAGDAVRTDRLVLDATWFDVEVLKIPLGGSSLALRSRDDGSLHLARPLILPLLDGRVLIEDLDWRDWRGPAPDLRLSARLEPVDLARLTRTLGWTEFGGTLSGGFPAARLRAGVIEFEGGLDVELFSGVARIENFAIERAFGTLPALAADLEFSALDLEQVTGAFEFGFMTGLLSGHVRRLRLLDWQPVQFDAWFETLLDAPRRRISQQAVGSLSSLSGGGGAMLSGTFLRFFKDFPYRRAGLGCRLHNNVCTMQGLDRAEGGGYMILEGRGLPRLNIVGFRRSVDWPRLMAQLKAVSGSRLE